MTDDKPAPCPFCGHERIQHGPMFRRGTCLYCGATGPEAYVDWNTRAAIESLSPASVKNPCAKIFDHKWLDPVCVEDGCCSLMLGNALKAYLKAQRRMLERWSECDEVKRNELWRELHACEDGARGALERWSR